MRVRVRRRHCNQSSSPCSSSSWPWSLPSSFLYLFHPSSDGDRTESHGRAIRFGFAPDDTCVMAADQIGSGDQGNPKVRLNLRFMQFSMPSSATSKYLSNKQQASEGSKLVEGKVGRWKVEGGRS
jgi:hypothetical protein